MLCGTHACPRSTSTSMTVRVGASARTGHSYGRPYGQELRSKTGTLQECISLTSIKCAQAIRVATNGMPHAGKQKTPMRIAVIHALINGALRHHKSKRQLRQVAEKLNIGPGIQSDQACKYQMFGLARARTSAGKTDTRDYEQLWLNACQTYRCQRNCA